MTISANLQTATACLNDWSSFLAFEKLTGPLSHCSRVYRAVCICSAFGLISAWSADLPENENRERMAQLLLDLNSTGFKSIQLLGHCGPDLVADQNPARAFFVRYGEERAGKGALLELCRIYSQPAVAFSENGKVAVFSSEGRAMKVFNKLTMTPAHLKRVWSAIAGTRYTWLESGICDVAPLMYRINFDRVGLGADGVVIERVYRTAPDLIRSRPFREWGDLCR